MCQRAVLVRQVGDEEPERIERRLGLMPVMVRSALCHLQLRLIAVYTRAEHGSRALANYAKAICVRMRQKPVVAVVSLLALCVEVEA